MNLLKVFFFKLYLFYENHFPIQRGKFVLSKILTSITGELNVKAQNGMWLRVIPSSPMDRSYLSDHNISHSAILNEIDKLKEGDVFIDIGCNIGYFSFKASSCVGKRGLVYSFEPSRREYRRFLYGVELNDLKNILPFNCALSNLDGVVKFQTDKYHTGLNRFDDEAIQQEDSFVVPVFNADTLINQKSIALVKIDVEGAEFKVLMGFSKMLKNKTIKRLIVEITPKFLKNFGSSKEELYGFMSNYQYIPLVNSTEWQFDEIFVLDEQI